MTDLVERLRHAHEHSQQRIAGSDIFKAAADEIERVRAERDAAARDMRERCAKVADEATSQYMAAAGYFKVEGKYRAVPVKDADDAQIKATAAAKSNASFAVAAAIRALPDTPAVMATDGGTNG